MMVPFNLCAGMPPKSTICVTRTVPLIICASSFRVKNTYSCMPKSTNTGSSMSTVVVIVETGTAARPSVAALTVTAELMSVAIV